VPRPVRIANCSGFYGDRPAAAREMLAGPVDVLTGDYLAELTMLILWKARRKDPGLGYATTFLTQMEEVLGTCLERGVKIVANAGGLNPAGLAAKITDLSARLGLNARVAHITGDDLIPALGDLQAAGHELVNLDTGVPLAKADLPVVTANAYLGGWGIAAALEAGADVVICPRVTDASLVTGPAAWWHGWRQDNWDALAGAVAAGHVIECGPQATGGNYSFLDEITDRRYPGFPVAEVAADGSSVVTKHDGTGGLVSVGTVTAQLLYEIGDPAYLNPDVVAHFDTIRLAQARPDRVALAGTRGSPPPDTLKVALNMLGGYRNTTTMVLTGLDIEEKARHAISLLTEVLGGTGQFDEFDVRLLRFDHPDAPVNEQATAHLRVTVKDQDERKVGRAFSNAAVELALAGYAGFHTTTPPTPASAFGIYWPAVIPAAVVTQQVHLPGGETRPVRHSSDLATTRPADTPGAFPRSSDARPARPPDHPAARTPDPVSAVPDALTAGIPGRAPAAPDGGLVRTPDPVPAVPDGGVLAESVPLGRICGARSGDKGGAANVGLWAVSPAAYAWLRGYLTVDRLRELLTEAADLDIDRYELPNLLAVNFVIHGLLAPGVSGTTRPDAQAKGLGEYLRSRLVPIPAGLI
jgi:acyclic terpene utilization AtuA family protein